MVCHAAAWAQAKYVFYFIGDGMGWGHVNAAQYYNRAVLGNSEPLLMMQFPVVGSAMTYSASSPVTDSAAAGTALATGHKTKNSMVGLAPDSVTALTSIARRFKDRGMGVGLLTTGPTDDATPAAFYAHQPSRHMKYEITCEAAASGYDIIGGGRFRAIGPDTDALEQFTSRGWTFITDPADPKAAALDKIIVEPSDSRSETGPAVDATDASLRLADMVRLAISHLSRVSPEGFFLMAEDGNIDHSAHGNDGGTIIKEVVDFQNAIRLAYDFYLAHPDETLIVVTADHDTGGFALCHRVNLAMTDSQRVSKDAMADHFRHLLKSGQAVTWDDMQQYLRRNLGFWESVKLTDAQTATLREKFEKTFVRREGVEQKTLYNTFDELVSAVFDVMNRSIGVYFTATGHSGNPVPVFAIGRGAELFDAMMENTAIPTRILRAASK